jgi:hypothetical protein
MDPDPFAVSEVGAPAKGRCSGRVYYGKIEEGSGSETKNYQDSFGT